MTSRFRLLAGPNGSGKSTLKQRLETDYAVNFYDFLNADDIFAEVRRTGCFAPRLPVEEEALRAYAERSSYDEAVKDCFRTGAISVSSECVRFATRESANSYTVALLTNFLQSEHIRQGISFSQETVFSHPSKIEALEAARRAGFRTYLYFVATDSPSINLGRIACRAAQGGHDVPKEKAIARYRRSLAQISEALKYLSRAYFFDNSSEAMRFLGSWNDENGFKPADNGPQPAWLRTALAAQGGS